MFYNTALYTAVEKNNKDIVKSLVQKQNVNPNIRSI